jgi:hypothetical protein
LNRVAKADYLELRQRALAEVAVLQQQGKWMSAAE